MELDGFIRLYKIFQGEEFLKTVEGRKALDVFKETYHSWVLKADADREWQRDFSEKISKICKQETRPPVGNAPRLTLITHWPGPRRTAQKQSEELRMIQLQPDLHSRFVYLCREITDCGEIVDHAGPSDPAEYTTHLEQLREAEKEEYVYRQAALKAAQILQKQANHFRVPLNLHWSRHVLIFDLAGTMLNPIERTLINQWASVAAIGAGLDYLPQKDECGFQWGYLLPRAKWSTLSARYICDHI